MDRVLHLGDPGIVARFDVHVQVAGGTSAHFHHAANEACGGRASSNEETTVRNKTERLNTSMQSSNKQ